VVDVKFADDVCAQIRYSYTFIVVVSNQNEREQLGSVKMLALISLLCTVVIVGNVNICDQSLLLDLLKG
jgi:hypothetical protein